MIWMLMIIEYGANEYYVVNKDDIDNGQYLIQ